MRRDPESGESGKTTICQIRQQFLTHLFIYLFTVYLLFLAYDLLTHTNRSIRV